MAEVVVESVTDMMKGKTEWFRLVWKLARQSRSGVSDGDPWYSVVCEL